jgi:hypothetical protein
MSHAAPTRRTHQLGPATSVSDSTLLFPRPGPVVRQCEFLLTPNSVSRAVTLHDRHDRVTSPARGPLSPQVPLALGLSPFSRSAALCRSAAFLAVAHTEPRNMAVQSAPPRHRAAAQPRCPPPRRAAASKSRCAAYSKSSFPLTRHTFSCQCTSIHSSVDSTRVGSCKLLPRLASDDDSWQ